MFDQLAALLLFDRDYGHRAHLRATAYSAHVALDEFYTDLGSKTDELIEAYQGRNGFVDIPSMRVEEDVQTPAVVIKAHLDIIEGTRAKALGTDQPLQNVLDEIVKIYLRVLFKLQLT